MTVFRNGLALALLMLVGGVATQVRAEEYDEEPINYSKSTPRNPVSQLIERMEKGTVRLERVPRFGYLKSLLKQLDIPESSQTLVYSKTSLQRERITPETPRAIYFNDDVYVGYCKDGDVLEISAADPQLGAVFYTLSQRHRKVPRIERQGENCLICHGSTPTKQVPGHLLRSVFVETSGLPIFSAESHRVDQTSPIEVRWGGWYVTGTHGSQKHRGNLVMPTEHVPNNFDNSAGQNLTDLTKRFDTAEYISKHSDLVALMVLEHQVEGHNRISRANYLTRQAMHYQDALNRELKEPPDHMWDSTKSRIKSGCEPLVEYLLYSNEAELKHRLTGTTDFEEQFSRKGPRDRQGRSLRDFDLTQRMFKFPCSYLIYSPSFQDLPQAARDYVFGRFWEILNDRDQTPAFAHLTSRDRRSLLEILRETLPNIPKSWKLAGN